MDSSTHQSYQNQNNQPNSGLLRFRSAPSSLLSNFTNGLDCGGVNNKGGGFDSDRLISRFMNSSGGGGDSVTEDKSGTAASAAAAVNYGNNNSQSQLGYSGLPPHYPRQSSATSSSSAMDNSSYELLGRMDHRSQGKPVTSSLMRQSSSPPGLFTNLSIQNGIIHSCSLIHDLSVVFVEVINALSAPFLVSSRLLVFATLVVVLSYHFNIGKRPYVL